MERKYNICSLIVTMSNVRWSNSIGNENCTLSYCIMHIDSAKNEDVSGPDENLSLAFSKQRKNIENCKQYNLKPYC